MIYSLVIIDYYEGIIIYYAVIIRGYPMVFFRPLDIDDNLPQLLGGKSVIINFVALELHIYTI